MQPAPSLSDLFRGFLGIGLTGFGGVLPWARRMVVDQRRWLSASEFLDLLALCQFLPGPNVVNLSVALGSRFRSRYAMVCYGGAGGVTYAAAQALGRVQWDIVCELATGVGSAEEAAAKLDLARAEQVSRSYLVDRTRGGSR